MQGWGITNTDDGEVTEYGSTIAVRDTVDRIADTSTSMYWTAPQAYLGNRVRYRNWLGLTKSVLGIYIKEQIR